MNFNGHHAVSQTLVKVLPSELPRIVGRHELANNLRRGGPSKMTFDAAHSLNSTIGNGLDQGTWEILWHLHNGAIQSGAGALDVNRRGRLTLGRDTWRFKYRQ